MSSQSRSRRRTRIIIDPSSTKDTKEHEEEEHTNEACSGPGKPNRAVVSPSVFYALLRVSSSCSFESFVDEFLFPAREAQVGGDGLGGSGQRTLGRPDEGVA